MTTTPAAKAPLARSPKSLRPAAPAPQPPAPQPLLGWALRLHPPTVLSLMKARNIESQAQLAKLSGVSRQTIITALSGQKVNDKTASRLASALLVSPDRIIQWVSAAV